MELITIGNKKIPVVAQRHARLRHYLGNQDFGKLMSGDYGAESYQLLSVLVPALPEAISLWEWDGYGSQEQAEQGNYIEDADCSPTTDEIVVAFETVLKVNGAGRLGKIMDLVKLGMQSGVQAQATQTSPVLPGESGA